MHFVTGLRWFMLDVSIIYCPEDKDVYKVELLVEPGSTINDVLITSKLFELYPETKDYAIGIYSDIADSGDLVRHGDRIEVYRPLKIDPKSRRRQKAKKTISR